MATQHETMKYFSFERINKGECQIFLLLIEHCGGKWISQWSQNKGSQGIVSALCLCSTNCCRSFYIGEVRVQKQSAKQVAASLRC